MESTLFGGEKYVIKLIDFYSGNRFDLQAVKDDGFTGVIFKAGQGVLADVPRIHPEWQDEARDAGLKVGWYWVPDSRVEGSRQVEAIDEWLPDFGELGLWMDAEKPKISWTYEEYWATRYAGQQTIYNIMVGVQQLGRSWFPHGLPGFYTNPDFWYNVFHKLPIEIQDWYSQALLWTAQYPYVWTTFSRPTMYGRWDKWTLWQYRGEPDIDIFNGTEEEFNNIFKSIAPAPESNVELKVSGYKPQQGKI